MFANIRVLEQKNIAEELLLCGTRLLILQTVFQYVNRRSNINCSIRLWWLW
jgi:hypothetical protein